MPVDDGFKGGVGSDRVGINVPVPDPSLLTTQQLREGLDGLEKLINVRLTAMDEATHLRMQMLLTVPGEIDKRIHHMREISDERAVRSNVRFQRADEEITRLKDLHNTKFDGITLQFHERDTRTDQTAATGKQALDAALLAAKELVGQQNEANAAAATKAELSTIKQIDQIVVLIGTIEKALGAQIIEIKERIDRNEGGVAGGREVTETRRADSSVVISIVAAVFSFVALTSGIVIAILNHRR